MSTRNEEFRTDHNDDLKEAVEGSHWTEAVRLVHSSRWKEEERQWAIEEIAKRAPERFVNEVIDDCASDLLDTVLSHVCTRQLWRCVLHILLRDSSNTADTLAWKQTFSHMSDDNCAWYILLLCFDDVLKYLMHQLVSEGLWASMGLMLQHGVSKELGTFIFEKASGLADDSDFEENILSHCLKEYKDQALTHHVSRGRWEHVGDELQSDISETQHRGAVEEASKHAYDDNFANYILPQCHEEELEHVVTHLVSQGQWRSVGQVLERGINTAHHRWAVEEACKHADDDDFADNILHYCTDEELEQVLTHMVSRGLWKPVNSVTHSDISVTQHILSQIVSRGLWRVVGRFLLRDIGSTHHRWAVEEASKHADDFDFADYILYQCHDEELEHVVIHLVSQGHWWSVGLVLEQGNNKTHHRWAVEEASKHAAADEFYYYILPQCHKEELEHVVTHLVSRGHWRSVGQVLQRGINTTHHRWAVEEASKYAEEKSFADHILHYCTDEELEQVITHKLSWGVWKPVYSVTHSSISIAQHMLSQIVPLGLWRAVGRFSLRDIGSTHHRWAVEEVSKHAHQQRLIYFIIPQCQEQELEHLVTHLVSQGQWSWVGHVLERGINTTHHRWAVEEASKHAEEKSFADHILHHCTDEELEQVLTHKVSQGLWKPSKSATHSGISVTQHMLSQIVSQGMWRAVGRFLLRDIGSTHHRWAVEEASKHADADDFAHYILSQCHEEEQEHVVTHLVSRGQWISVAQVLKRGINTTHHRWAIEEASKHAAAADFADYILSQCYEEELEHVVTHLVSRGQWRSVGQVLKRGINTTHHIWAVEEASKHAAADDFADYILSQCYEEELEHVVTHLVSRGQWRSVGQVLNRGINTTHHRWAVEEASKHADEKSIAAYILHHCADEELEQVLAHMVSRGLWKPVNSVTHRDISVTQHILSQIVSRGLWTAVGRFLLRDISSTQHRWAVEQARKCAAADEFDCDILPYSLVETDKQVLEYLVSRRVWQCVGRVLQTDISSTQHRWAVEEAFNYANDDNCVKYILPQCHEEEVQHAVTHLVSWGRWRLVGQVLERGINTTHHRWAVEEALKHSHDAAFADFILPQCHEEYLEHVVTHLVSRGQWRSVGKVLERGINTIHHSWVVEEASKHACEKSFVDHILHHCADEELEQVLTHMVSRGLWKPLNSVTLCDISVTQYILSQIVSRGLWTSVGRFLLRNISSTQCRWAVEEAGKHSDDVDFYLYILPHCSGDAVVAMIPHLVAKKKWSCTRHIFHDIVCDTLYAWVTSGHDSRVHDTLFWTLIHSCYVEVSLALDMIKAVTQDMTDARLAIHVCWERNLCELLTTSLLHTVCSVVCSDARQHTDSIEQTKQCVSDIYTHITDCIRDNTDSIQHNTLKIIQNKEKWTSLFTDIANTHRTDPLFLLHFLQGINLYHDSRRGQKDDAILEVMFAVLPLFPQLQSVALRIMVREKRWDVISQACLSHVWEHDRRRLFTAAVEQRQWSVVERWSDHTVHDDQREWAMKVAFREGQWEVYLLLADHGLTMPEQMHAHYMVAKYGDWDTVLQMAERGGDVTEVSVLLENYVTKQLRRKPQGDVTRYIKRCKNLIRLRVYMATDSALSPMKVLERGKWHSVLFHILHKPTEDYFSRVMDTAIKKRAWPVLMHLVRLGMKTAERDWLFPEMVRQQQWGVCRMLLEYGVDVQLCLEALEELKEKNQWTLVARVMEYEVDDALRRQVMQCAFQRREGALFWHCLTTMKDKEDMTVETREKLFHQAISRDIWQAVKPLVEENDSLGIQHRDIAFLEAIEQHLWDVVDHCQLYGADINMKDENEETPLHREARKGEWKAVEEIVLRDGDPNLLDMEGFSVLNRLIHNEQWDIVKTVIKYGGNIHLPARYKYEARTKETYTPLQLLINKRQLDVIQFTIIWCPDQWKGVNDAGETTLHAACDSDRWDVMWNLVARKVDPLAVTKRGQTALVYAVLNTKCPQRMVAECSRLGFSTHQPSVTGLQEMWMDDVIIGAFWCWSLSHQAHGKCFSPDYLRHSEITSPLLCAVLLDLPVVTLMLCESGACSDTELITLYTQLLRLTDSDRAEGRIMYAMVQRAVADALIIEKNSFPWERRRDPYHYLQYYFRLTHIIDKYTAFLRQLATTPRTLQSSCRLLISHRLGGHDKNRYKRVDQCPLPVPLKNYILFSDLRDPDYGKHMGLPSDDT